MSESFLKKRVMSTSEPIKLRSRSSMSALSSSGSSRVSPSFRNIISW